jgi:hypothetical protein
VAPTIGAMPRVSGKRQAADDEVSETRDHRAWLSGHDPELEWMRAERLRVHGSLHGLDAEPLLSIAP